MTDTSTPLPATPTPAAPGVPEAPPAAVDPAAATTAPAPADMTRAQRLAAANERFTEWAKTATTDDPPDSLFEGLARTEDDFKAMAGQNAQAPADAAPVDQAAVTPPATPAAPVAPTPQSTATPAAPVPPAAPPA